MNVYKWRFVLHEGNFTFIYDFNNINVIVSFGGRVLDGLR